MALTFTTHKKLQEIFKDEQCSGKLSIDSSKNIGENGKDGKNKSSLYFSNIEIDNSYNKETILKALDENVIISTNEKMSREYVVGDLIMTPNLCIFCVTESKNDNHKFDLEQYGKIINETEKESTIIKDFITKIEIKDVSTDTRVCPAPVNRSTEAKRSNAYIMIEGNNRSTTKLYFHKRTPFMDYTINTRELLDIWRGVSSSSNLNFLGYVTRSYFEDSSNSNVMEVYPINDDASNPNRIEAKNDDVIIVYDSNRNKYVKTCIYNTIIRPYGWIESEQIPFIFTKADTGITHNHFIDDSTYIIGNFTTMGIKDSSNILYYSPSTMVYNYYKNEWINTPNTFTYDTSLNFDTLSQFDRNLYTEYESANRQMYGIKFKPNIYLQNPGYVDIDFDNYDFTLRIGLKNKKKYGSDSSYSYYLGESATETFLKDSPYDNDNSIESVFFKNLYIPLNKITNSNSSTNEIFLSDVTMDRFHLFGNEYQSNIINTNMTTERQCSFKHNNNVYATRIFGTTLCDEINIPTDYYTPINIFNINNKEYIKCSFYLNNTYYHYPYVNSELNINRSHGYNKSFPFIQRPIRKIGNKNTIHYRSGESVYFSSIVPNDSSGWCDDYTFDIFHSKYNIYRNPNEVYENQIAKLNKFDDYILLSHLSNPNVRMSGEYTSIKEKATNQIGLLVAQEIVKFLFNEAENEYELICINKNTQQVYYINLKNESFKNKFVKTIPPTLTDYYYNHGFEGEIDTDTQISLQDYP